MKTKKEKVGSALTVALAVLIGVLIGYLVGGPRVRECIVCTFHVGNHYYLEVKAPPDQKFLVSGISTEYFRLDQGDSFAKSEVETLDKNDPNDPNYVLNPIQLEGPWLLTTDYDQGPVYFTVSSESAFKVFIYPSWIQILTCMVFTALVSIIVWALLKVIRQKIVNGRKPKQLKLPMRNRANDTGKF